jgi:hypothetical protein
MKNISKSIRAAALLHAAAVLISGCASATIIQSIPSGARLYIDGEPVGNTPYTYTDEKIVGSTTMVKLEMWGYETINVSFQRNEEVDAGAVVGGFICVLPFLWTMKYKPSHTYELKPTVTVPDPTLITIPQPKSKAERLCELKQLLDEKIITR